MSQIEIYRCPLAESQEALRCLHHGISADQQDALVATLEQLRRQDAIALENLIIAKEQDQILAATWVQPAPGNTAILWPPDFTSPAASELMRFVDGILNEWQVPLAQMVIGSSAEVDIEALALADFHRLVELDYLSLEQPQADPKWPASTLHFEPDAAKHPTRLHDVILQSYEETLDCPQLNDLRDPEDVVASYRAQGEYKGENWFLVQSDRTDIGVLILADHNDGKVLELVYMGVAPRVRGRAFGEHILHHAIRCAANTQAERLVLAVDTQNNPAQAMYRRAGFTAWDRRTVYARVAD
ncbi:GNAT family N-acetyltransferase [Bythopirellula goksoeyrii]|nr:GNAT family N-acetyltransferase [Bythopirellula goksoeyrii]